MNCHLEKPNEGNVNSRITGIKICESNNRQHGTDYLSVIPTNLYSTGDHFHPEELHAVPALIRRFHEAKESGVEEVMIWKTESPFCIFLHVSDIAEASLFVLNLEKEIYETNKPDDTPQKLMDSYRLADMRWQAGISLKEGLANAYRWFYELE